MLFPLPITFGIPRVIRCRYRLSCDESVHATDLIFLALHTCQNQLYLVTNSKQMFLK